MNYNIEEIPVEIFEWMNDTHFYALKSDQQKQVLRFFTHAGLLLTHSIIININRH